MKKAGTEKAAVKKTAVKKAVVKKATGVEEKIAKILKKHHFAVFATLTEGPKPKPWVRYVFVNSDSEFNIWFATFKSSRKVVQIKRNPEVHLTLGVDASDEMGNYLQIQGKAKLVTDKKILQAKWNKEWATYFKGADDPNYAIISVAPYRIEFVTMKGPEVWEAKKATT